MSDNLYFILRLMYLLKTCIRNFLYWEYKCTQLVLDAFIFHWRRKRDSNSRAACTTSWFSRPAPSASWVFLHITFNLYTLYLNAILYAYLNRSIRTTVWSYLLLLLFLCLCIPHKLNLAHLYTLYQTELYSAFYFLGGTPYQ